MKDFDERILKFKNLLADCDYVLIGAGAGLSTSAGFEYSGENFKKYFSDFIDKYGFTDMYQGGFYPYESEEEKWAYWSRYVFLNRYKEKANELYKLLFNLVKNKDYFVITTNVDHQFQLAGFDKDRLFYTQGDYGLFQCSIPCHSKTYDNETQILEVVKTQKDMKIPSFLIPRCPVCGKPMEMNLRSDDRFVEDEGWHLHAKRYGEFLEKINGKKVLLLELGVGYNTPSIIKYPFERMTLKNSDFYLVRINISYPFCPAEIKDKTILFDEDIKKVLEKIR